MSRSKQHERHIITNYAKIIVNYVLLALVKAVNYESKDKSRAHNKYKSPHVHIISNYVHIFVIM